MRRISRDWEVSNMGFFQNPTAPKHHGDESNDTGWIFQNDFDVFDNLSMMIWGEELERIIIWSCCYPV